MTTPTQPAHRYKVRTLFISDLHLGSRNCKAKFLRELLNRADAEQIYLVGDIIDGHRLRHERYWPQEHEQVMDLLHEKAQAGCSVTYIAGNHDEGLREWLAGERIDLDSPKNGLKYRCITYKPMAIHTDARDRKHLVLHTDQFDGSTTRWFYDIGDVAYDALAWSNRQLNHVREKLGMPYWSLAGIAKKSCKRALGAFNRVDEKLVSTAQKHGVVGIIGGHTHDPVNETVCGIEVRNDGDMVDSITALVEDFNGRLQLLPWAPLVNDYKQRVRQNQPHPQAAFAPLAIQYGAVPQQGDVMHDFSRIAAQPDTLNSRYGEIIELATHGIERMGLSLLKAVPA